MTMLGLVLLEAMLNKLVRNWQLEARVFVPLALGPPDGRTAGDQAPPPPPSHTPRPRMNLSAEHTTR
jgi:hypothetical protein